MTYLRSREDALDAAAEILDLPLPDERLAQCALRLPLCREAEPRTLLEDFRDFLLLGGLDSLARRRRETPAPGRPPRSPEEERTLDVLGTSRDALRGADLVRQVFPGLRHERWQIARAVLRDEAALRDLLIAAIRARGARPSALDETLEKAVGAARPPWLDRAGSLLATCRDALRSAGEKDPDTLRNEATRLFELAALEDVRAEALLAGLATHPARSFVELLRLRDLADAV